MTTRAQRILTVATTATAVLAASAGTALADDLSPVPGKHDAGSGVFGFGDSGSSGNPFVPRSFFGATPAPPGVYLWRPDTSSDAASDWPHNCNHSFIIVTCN